MSPTGPHPPWATDVGDLYENSRQKAAEFLREDLLARLQALDGDPSAECITLECRRQIADATVTGHLGRVPDILDLMMEMLSDREYASRLVP